MYLRVVSLLPWGARGMSSQTEVVTVGTPATPPGPPTLSQPVLNGLTVTLNWAPGSGSAPTSYTLYAGTRSGVSDVGVFSMGTATSITASVPAGVAYYVRVIAANAAGQATSNEVSFQAAAPVPPGAPTLHPASVSGGIVTLSWSPPASGGASAGYVVRARLSAGGPIAVTMPVGGTTLSVAAPRGRYYVDVVATNSAGAGPASNLIEVIVP
jgi:hypothetical protein